MWPESGKAARHAPWAHSDLSIEVCIISVDTWSQSEWPIAPRDLPNRGNCAGERVVQLPRFDVGAPFPASGETFRSGPHPLAFKGRLQETTDACSTQSWARVSRPSPA